MIDLPLFKAILEAPKQNGWIEHSDLISESLQLFLMEFTEHDVLKLFKKEQSNLTGPKARKFKVVVECCHCKQEDTIEMNKTKLLRFLFPVSKAELKRWPDRKKFNTPRKFECNNCKSALEKSALEKAERDRKEAEEQKNADAKIDLNTIEFDKLQSFCETYLDPLKSWNEGLKIWEQIQQLQYHIGRIDADLLAEHIKLMPYQEFLKTPYWKAIASDVRKQAGFKCKLCSTERTLHVHHNTYDHRGYEFQYREKDLICLCADCHGTFHRERELADVR